MKDLKSAGSGQKRGRGSVRQNQIRASALDEVFTDDNHSIKLRDAIGIELGSPPSKPSL